jgi:hypothetical protein
MAGRQQFAFGVELAHHLIAIAEAASSPPLLVWTIGVSGRSA